MRRRGPAVGRTVEHCAAGAGASDFLALAIGELLARAPSGARADDAIAASPLAVRLCPAAEELSDLRCCLHCTRVPIHSARAYQLFKARSRGVFLLWCSLMRTRMLSRACTASPT